MIYLEKSFPRGGTLPKKKLDEKENITFGALVKKTKKQSSKSKKLDNLTQQDELNIVESLSTELLSYDTVQDGMLIMGKVDTVNPLYLNISLPGGLRARASALDISEAYTKAAREFLEQSETLANFKPLNELYEIGQVVYGRVMDIKQVKTHKSIVFSLKPIDVHADLTHTNINKGFIFNGAVQEVQEHGYIIETGIHGLRAFLSTANASKELSVGELVYLKVEKITHDQTVSTSVCKAVKFEAMRIKDRLDARLDYILPTTIVQFNVTKQLKDGLQGSIMNEAFTAYVNEHHLSTTVSTPEDYELNSSLRARLLYVMPLTKLVYLTLNLSENTSTAVYKRGDVVENAVVSHMGTRGVNLLLDGEHKGLVSYKTIKANYKGNYDKDELLIRYAKNTKHKLRILQYDIMDGLYNCSDDPAIVQEQFFSFEDLKPGASVQTVVQAYNEHIGGYDLRLGKLHARIEALYLSGTSKGLDKGAKFRCRVLGCNLERRVVYVTNRSEYMQKDCPLLTTLKQAKTNAIFMGTIVKEDEHFWLVRFFNNIKGLLSKLEIADADSLQSYYVGHTALFRIASRQDEHIRLSLPNCMFQTGDIRDVKVLNQLDVGLEVTVAVPKSTEDNDENDDDDDDNVDEAKVTQKVDEMKGLVPIRLLSDFSDLLRAKLHLYSTDTELKAVCIHKNIFSLRDVKYYTEHADKSLWRNIRVNDVLRAVIKRVEDEVVELMLHVRDHSQLVRVHWQMLLMGVYKNINIVLSPEQLIYVRVIGKEAAVSSITVSAKLTDVWSGKLTDTATYIESYMDELAEIRKTLKVQKNPLAKYTRGEKIFAIFEGVNKETGDWLYKVEETDITAVIRSTMLGKKTVPPEVGRKQECIVLWVDYSAEIVFVSNRPGDVEHISKLRKLPENLKGKSGMAAKVLLKLETVFICSLKKGNNPLIYCPIRLHYNDFECTASTGITEGNFVRLAFVHDNLPIAVLESTSKLWQEVNLKRKKEEKLQKLSAKRVKLEKKENNEKQNKTKKQKQVIVEDIKEELEVASSKEKRKAVETSLNCKKQKNNDEDNCLFFEDTLPNTTLIENNKDVEYTSNKLKEDKLPGIGDFWSTDLTKLQTNDDESDEDDANETEQAENDKRPRKLTANEKYKQQQAEEARLRTIEEKYADPKQLPETVDQYDRLVLSAPNESKNWINYMVHFLQSAEIDKARAVARRALKAISFRHSEELLNIWIALLNLELRYDTLDSYKSVLQESLTYNEPLHVYLRVLELLSAPDCNKEPQLLDVIALILRKFKTNFEVWRAAATAYFSIGMIERAQQLLSKSLTCLPERDHVNTIVSFANMNHKYGQKELAHTLLDQVVTSYPKRVDVWTQYVDMLVKDELIESARNILDRAITHKIPLKKMRTLFKKYMEFEERFGTAADMEKVKELAIEYVKKHTAL